MLVGNAASLIERAHISHEQHVVERHARALGHIFQLGEFFLADHAAQNARSVLFLVLFRIGELDLVLDHAHVLIKSLGDFLLLLVIEAVTLIVAAVAVLDLDVRLFARRYLRVGFLHEHQKLLGVLTVHAHMVEHLNERVAPVRAANERNSYLQLGLDGDLLRQKFESVLFLIVGALEDDEVLFGIIVIDLPIRGYRMIDKGRMQNAYPVYYVLVSL